MIQNTGFRLEKCVQGPDNAFNIFHCSLRAGLDKEVVVYHLERQSLDAQCINEEPLKFIILAIEGDLSTYLRCGRPKALRDFVPSRVAVLQREDQAFFVDPLPDQYGVRLGSWGGTQTGALQIGTYRIPSRFIRSILLMYR